MRDDQLPQLGKQSVTHIKYSNASSWSFLISKNSNPSSARLEGSILYFFSTSASPPYGYACGGDIVSGTGPTIKLGHIPGSALSKYKVNNLPDFGFNESTLEYDEERLGFVLNGNLPSTAPGPAELEADSGCGLVALEVGRLLFSQAGESQGDIAGITGLDAEVLDALLKSSASEVWVLSAKLLVNSTSDTIANEDCEETVDVEDVVRWRGPVPLEPRCSSCHVVLVVSTAP
jgi:hypothetical protein